MKHVLPVEDDVVVEFIPIDDVYQRAFLSRDELYYVPGGKKKRNKRGG